MGEMEAIAVGKIHASGREIVTGLQSEIKALERQYAARGMGGGIIHEGMKLCGIAISQQGRVIAEQFQWVITESLWTPQIEINRYVGLYRELIEPVMDETQQVMKHLTELIRLERKLPEYFAELDVRRDEVWTEVDLSLRATAATAKRRKIRGAGEGLINWISNLFGRSK